MARDEYANHIRYGHVMLIGTLFLVVIEAKALATRETIRMAVGQLLDYSNRRDLFAFLHSHSIGVIVPTSDGLFEVIAHTKRN